ncbi:intracellular growth attenuator family protein [Chitinivorax sp. B]|uniref:intracellular growth attenuator family protein n=1 Tax=Chitinivorax sp. B TaxID=2502235 RepID=UPI0010F66F59|nr:intracellular growth attenuator family protein [Chitinivorax sp. B]
MSRTILNNRFFMLERVDFRRLLRQALLIFCIVFMCAFFALLVVAELLPVMLGALGALGFATWSIYILFSPTKPPSKSWPFLAIAGLVLTIPLISLASRLPLQNLIDLILFGMAPLAIKYLFNATRHLAWVRFSILFYLGFLAFAVLSTLFGRSNTYAAIYQTIFNLKLYLMLGSGFAVVWTLRADQRLWIWVQRIWLIFLPFILLQWFAPAVDWVMFPLHSDKMYDLNPFLANKFVKVPGPFFHASMLATFTALMLGFCVLRFLIVGGNDCITPIVGYGFVLLASGQRGETLSLFASLFFVLVFYKQRIRWGVLLMLSTVFLLGLIFLVVNFENTPIYDLAVEWGLVGNIPLKDLQARAAFYKYSFLIANDHFPLGSGLGTYGGVGAQKFDLSLFDQLGFQRYYWYLAGQFLVDTYWPNFIAEAGWLGAFLMLLSIACLWIQSFVGMRREVDAHVKFYWSMANACATFILINSLTSPLAADPKYVWMCWMFFGLAASLGKAQSTANDDLVKIRYLY